MKQTRIGAGPGTSEGWAMPSLALRAGMGGASSSCSIVSRCLGEVAQGGKVPVVGLREQLAHRAEAEIAQQLFQAFFRSMEIHIMTEGPQPARSQPRLVGIELPGVDVNGERPAFGIDRFEPLPRKRVRLEAEVTDAADGQRAAAAPVYCCRKPPNRASGAGDPNRHQRRAGDAVAVVENRVNAGIVQEAFFHQHVQGPKALLGDGETRGAVSSYRLTRNLLDDIARPTEIVAEFLGRLLVDETVPITV